MHIRMYIHLYTFVILAYCGVLAASHSSFGGGGPPSISKCILKGECSLFGDLSRLPPAVHDRT